MNKIKFTHIALLCVFALTLIPPSIARAQIYENVVEWSKSIKKGASDEERILEFTATPQDGWHVYDLNLPEGGPQSTEFIFDKIEGAQLVGKPFTNIKPDEVYDKNFGMNLRWYHSAVVFSQKIKITDPEKFGIAGAVRYMACNDNTCTPPTEYEFTFGTAESGSATEATMAPGTGVTETNSETLNKATPDALDPEKADNAAKLGGKAELWTPVVSELRSYGDETLGRASSSLWKVFLYGFLGGLIALLTPCVWPMIPMTVSFFLKRSKDRKKAIRDAITYGLGIIIIYLTLGLLITGIFGASALNSLSTSAVFNIIFFLLLVFFAVSFFGAFEIVLPAKWTNKMDQKADSTTGLLSIFFMAFTLVLVSFSCTGPIIGTLLVEAATMGSWLGPAIGMFGFALALALPFSFFAVFPNMLQSMPQSGGWLNSVKVVLAFLELALAFKFLSVADLAYGWHILDREVFVSLWIIIFALLGLYLLGKLTFPHDTPVERVSVPRLFMAIVSLAFAIYMVPGLWGAPLKSISAFAPPLNTQDFNLYKGEVHAQFQDYDTGMEYAKKVGKPVLIDFSGYGCVNCRKMESAVWIDPQVNGILNNDYILITLIVDDKTNLPQPIEIKENGRTRKLRTVGDKWSYLQRSKFNSNAQPFYVPLDHDGKPLGPSRQYNEDVNEYVKFLHNGLTEFKTRTNQ
ncbi:Thiol:disulfide interchange protein DsbD precursor [Porphyromonas macacae]|uniref:Thiol:disulfide interchange protein DsbD n=1 Tax=Porphyromonas macacae TaxID=28115 RepID=A0A379E6M6_9PORP|nr:cytochrome c biogenesis protein CcdA [Porphyromonas macacae]SUB88316.1 Thiol:disulfide interchange protein DsbD precursor [Porphyromonas macacae]